MDVGEGGIHDEGAGRLAADVDGMARGDLHEEELAWRWGRGVELASGIIVGVADD